MRDHMGYLSRWDSLTCEQKLVEAERVLGALIGALRPGLKRSRG